METKSPWQRVNRANSATQALDVAEIRPVASNKLLENEIDQTLVIYDPQSDAVHVLNETAAAIWKLCDGRRSGQQIAQEVARLFGAQEVRIEADVLNVLSELLTARALFQNDTPTLGTPRIQPQKPLGRN